MLSDMSRVLEILEMLLPLCSYLVELNCQGYCRLGERIERERERERENVVAGVIVFIEQKSSGAQSSHSLHNIVPSPASHRPSTNMICKCKISIFI